MKPNGDQKGAKVSKRYSKIKPWSVRKISFSTVSFVRQNGKNGHGTLFGFTMVKGASAENFFYFRAKKNKIEKYGFWHLWVLR